LGTSIELGQTLNALLYASLIRQEYIDECEKQEVEETVAPNSAREMFENINIGSINNSDQNVSMTLKDQNIIIGPDIIESNRPH